MKHLLVTNDFPPKIGGIQSYLWELWRRLPPEDFEVMATPHTGATAFDTSQTFAIHRAAQSVLLPTPALRRQVQRRAIKLGADLVMLDPAIPLGLMGPRLDMPYGVIVHGAELSVPAHLPGVARALRRVVRGASCVIASGHWAAAQAVELAGGGLPMTLVPPGVDCTRFRPFSVAEREATRRRFGLALDARMVLMVSRLVPRKGADVLLAACSLLAPDRPDLVLVIAGEGRERSRLQRLAAGAAVPVHFTGRVDEGDLPGLIASADVFSMLCQSRWGGLEQEGFGIVFLEAAACGVPQVAGRSGGAAEAVADGETGFVVDRPIDPAAAAVALARVLDDRDLRERQGRAARRRAQDQFSYDRLALVLGQALADAP